MAFFTQETIEEKNNMLLIFTCLLILIFSVFILIKFETLTGVAVSLGAVIFCGVLIIVLIWQYKMWIFLYKIKRKLII